MDELNLSALLLEEDEEEDVAPAPADIQQRIGREAGGNSLPYGTPNNARGADSGLYHKQTSGERNGGPDGSGDDTTVAYRSTHIDHVLDILGIPPLHAADRCQSPDDANAALEVVERLLDLHRYNKRMYEDLQATMDRLKDDRHQQDLQKAELKNAITEVERERDHVQEELRQARVSLGRLQSDLKAQQAETKRVRQNSEALIKQHVHERKRLERQYDNLRESLQKKITQQDTRGVTIHCLNEKNRLTRPTGSRGKWAVPKTATDAVESEMQEMLEQRVHALQAENNKMREALANVDVDLGQVLQSSKVPRALDESAASLDGSFDATNPLGSGHFQMPYELASARIEKSLRTKLERLGQRMDALAKQHSEDGDTDDVATLKAEIEELKSVMHQQQQLLLETEAGLSSSFAQDRSFLKSPHTSRGGGGANASLLHHQAQSLQEERAQLNAWAVELAEKEAAISRQSDDLRRSQLRNKIRAPHTLSWLETPTKPNAPPVGPAATTSGSTLSNVSGSSRLGGSQSRQRQQQQGDKAAEERQRGGFAGRDEQAQADDTSASMASFSPIQDDQYSGLIRAAAGKGTTSSSSLATSVRSNYDAATPVMSRLADIDNMSDTSRPTSGLSSVSDSPGKAATQSAARRPLQQQQRRGARSAADAASDGWYDASAIDERAEYAQSRTAHSTTASATATPTRRTTGRSTNNGDNGGSGNSTGAAETTDTSAVLSPRFSDFNAAMTEISTPKPTLRSSSFLPSYTATPVRGQQQQQQQQMSSILTSPAQRTELSMAADSRGSGAATRNAADPVGTLSRRSSDRSTAVPSAAQLSSGSSSAQTSWHQLSRDTDAPTTSSSPRNQDALRSMETQQQQQQQQHRSPGRRISGGLSSQSSPQQSSPLARAHTSARHAPSGADANGHSHENKGGSDPLPAKWMESVGLERLQDLRSRLEAVGVSPSSEQRQQSPGNGLGGAGEGEGASGTDKEDHNTSAPIHVAGHEFVPTDEPAFSLSFDGRV